MSVKPHNICHTYLKMLKAVSTHHLSHSCFCSISSVIVWHTFMLAIVLRSIDVVEGILAVAVPTKEAAIEIELVN